MTDEKAGGEVGSSQPLPRDCRDDKPEEAGIVDLAADASASTTSSSSADGRKFAKLRDNNFLRKCWNIVSWTPKRCRWNPEDPPEFSMALNLLFGFVSIFKMLISFVDTVIIILRLRLMMNLSLRKLRSATKF